MNTTCISNSVDTVELVIITWLSKQQLLTFEVDYMDTLQIVISDSLGYS